MKKLALGFGFVLFLSGCGGAKVEGGTTTGGDAKAGELGRIDQGSRCELGEDRVEELVDLDQNGTPDVRKVYGNSAEGEKTLLCREADLNFDGTKDIFIFFDPDGKPIRDEVDLDFDGKIDIISLYEKGKVVKQNFDSNSDGLVDRVRYMENDVPLRIEGDTNGDGQVDLWEYYEGGALIRVGEDRDGDGRADNWARDDAAARSVVDDTEDETPQEEGEEQAEEDAEGADKPEDAAKETEAKKD